MWYCLYWATPVGVCWWNADACSMPALVLWGSAFGMACSLGSCADVMTSVCYASYVSIEKTYIGEGHHAVA